VPSPNRKALVVAPILAILCALSACSDRERTPPYAPQELRDAASQAFGDASPVVIHEPPQLTSIESGKVDALGRPIRVACVTCHSLRTPAALPERAEDLKDFHRGLRFAHGANRCATCHVVGEQDRLRLADGTTIDNRDAMRLCAQCHGPQHRDYQRGAHGGMSGSWDLESGPRMRNHCVDCHDPHAPKFAPARPVLPPGDRGLGSANGHGTSRGAWPRLSGGEHP
jgi:formate-dependent nitrite reductase cytochrome c552 subunit